MEAEVLDARLLAASRHLTSGGYGPESLDLYTRYGKTWRLLTELLELMVVAGYPEAEVALIRDLKEAS